jgi:hypothetical protein
MTTRSVLVLGAAALLITAVAAQEMESTKVTTTTTTLPSGIDFFAPLNIDDAATMTPGQLDLRLRYEWVTGIGGDDEDGGWFNLVDENQSRDNEPQPDEDDNHVIAPSLVWGPCPNVQVSLDLPINLGDSGDADGGYDGNGDLRLGLQYRFWEGSPGDWVPAFAMSTTLRLPTGAHSSGVDGELRAIFSNEYDSGLRSHLNGFVVTVNGDNEPDLRDFQWGLVVGMDGPLCADGAVRWVADYMHRNSFHEGASNMNVLELGSEWVMAENSKLGMSAQIGLDDHGDTPAFGLKLNYSYSLMY